MNKDKKKESVISITASVIYVILYIACISAQMFASRGGGVRQPGVQSAVTPNIFLLGLMSGAQIIMSMLIVVIAPYKKTGAVAMTIANIIGIAVSSMILVKSGLNAKSAPGIVIYIITIIVSLCISYYYQRAREVNEIVKKKYDELNETHKVLEEKQEKLQYMVYYDVLTDMPNRQRFMEEIDILAKDSQSPFTVIIACVNEMKNVANKYGNNVSDKVINTFASRIKEYCGNSIFASRFSGDEFGFIVKGNLSNSNKMMFIQMIQSKLTDPITIDSNAVQFSCNMGVSTFPDDSSNSSDILKYAESALSFSKSSGENMIFVSHKDVAVRVNL